MKLLSKTIVATAATLFGTVALAQCNISNITGVWDVVNNPSTKLDITGASAMSGDCGLDVEVMIQNGGQSSRHYVQDGSPNAETRYRAAFCVDPNSLPMATTGSNRRVKAHIAQCSGGDCANSDIVQIKFASTAANQYELDFYVRDDSEVNVPGPSTRNRHLIAIPNAPTRVEYDLDLAAGTFKLWVNATAESDPRAVEITGMDTTPWPKITRARLGSMDKSNNAGVGSHFYLDEFESRRSTFIGGTCTTPAP